MKNANVKIADLKNRLSEHLRGVRRGHPIVVLDRDTPVARIIPYAGEDDLLPARRPLGKYKRLGDVPLPPPVALDIDAVSLLLEDRRGGR